VKYIPLIARNNDPAVYRWCCSDGDNKKLAGIVSKKRVWSVYDTVTNNFLPQPITKGFQTKSGCQKRCDKLNAA
jgi:hypothetical protein